MSLSLLSCQEEELQSISSELELTETTSYEFTDLDENAIQANSFLQKNLFNRSQIKRQAKSMNSEAIYNIKIFGMTLQANLATQISNDSIATYTFNLLDKENFLEGSLANLVLVENKFSQETYTFFVSYNNWEEVSSGATNMLEYSYRLLSGDSKPEITKGQRVAMSIRDCEAWELIDCLNHLPEVVLTTSTRRYEPIVLMMEPGLFDGGSEGSGFGADPGMGNWAYSGGGGGSGGKYPTTPTVPDPKTPCEQAKEMSKKAKKTYNEALFQKRLEELKKGTKILERGFYFGYHPIVKNFQVSLVEIGTETGIFLGIKDPNIIVTGNVHAHPSKGLDSFSTEDFYGLIEANNVNPDFVIIFVLGEATNEFYSLGIVDSEKMNSFFKQYPPGQHLDPNTNGWKKGSPIYRDFMKAFDEFSKLGKTDHEAYALANAYVHNKYDTGLAMSKRNSNGEFEPIFIEKTKKPKKNKAKYKQTSDCNL